MPQERSELNRGSLLLACLFAATCASADPPKWFKEIDRLVFKRTQLTGYRSLSYHSHKVTGDREAYNTTNYYGFGNRKFTDVGQVSLSGRNVLGILNFEGTILDDRLTDPQSQRLSLNYKKDGWAVDAGDIQGTLVNTNPYAAMNRSMKGVGVAYRSKGFVAKVVTSEAKGSARTVSIPGANSSGPYYLQSPYLVYGSESVRLDDRPMQAGQDYTINYEAGSLTFVNRIIPPTSTILVTFEAYGFNEKRGTIQGAGVSYDMGKAGKIGVTAMKQTSPNRGGSSTRLEKFEGFGAASTPYFLQFEPLAGSVVIIRVNGVLQAEGVDYRFDAANSSVFYFNRFMPRTDQIDVVYTPRPRGTVDGDREVTGLDYQLPLGKNGQITVYQAMGRLKKTVTPSSGLARGGNMDYQWGDYRLSASATDVPSGFVGVENASFNRNERAHRLGLVADPKGPWSWELTQNNNSITTKSTDAQGNPVFSSTRFSGMDGAVTFAPKDGVVWLFNHGRRKTRSISSVSRVDSSELTGNAFSGPLNLRFGLSRQEGYGQGTDGVRQKFSILGAKVGSGYSRGPISANANLQFVNINSGGQKGNGKDIELNVSYAPTSTLRLTAGFADSNSGELSTLARYTNGYGVGYDGNGFTGGADGLGITGATNLRRWNLNAQWNPSSRLSLVGDWRRYEQYGSVSSNSATKGYGVSLNYQLGRGNTVTASYDHSDTTFAESPLQSGVNAYTVYWDGRPPGRLSYSVGWSLFEATGNSTFRQNNGSFYANAQYALGGRHTISFDWNGAKTSGYLPQNQSDLSLIYSYRIWQGLNLNAAYRWRRVSNQDPLLSSGAYRSNGLDVELSFTFGR